MKFQLPSCRLISATLLGAGLTVASLPAHAWGDREQGILTGIAASYLWREIHDDRHHRDRVVVRPAPAPVVIEQPPQVIYRDRRGPDVVVVREHPGHGYGRSHKNKRYERDDDCRSVPVTDSRGRVIEFRVVCDD